MASDKQNLQDAFLNQVRKTKVPVTIFLINGVKLQGCQLLQFGPQVAQIPEIQVSSVIRIHELESEWTEGHGTLSIELGFRQDRSAHGLNLDVISVR